MASLYNAVSRDMVSQGVVTLITPVKPSGTRIKMDQEVI